MKRPRLRHKQKGEVGVPAYESLQENSATAQRMMGALLRGVFTREYAEVLPEMAETAGVSRSSISRQAIEGSVELSASYGSGAEAAVRSFIGQKGYRFPVALSHGSIDEAYQATTIPQLYVIDAQGRIRFHVTGYEGEGCFSKNLHWMVQAAQQPVTP